MDIDQWIIFITLRPHHVQISFVAAAGKLVIVLVAIMFLSNLVINAAAVVLMAPIGIRVAPEMDVSPDPFLIAIGASCAFLIPIGHQFNRLVMDPDGYKFSDYWQMGLILEILLVDFAIPLILIFWLP